MTTAREPARRGSRRGADPHFGLSDAQLLQMYYLLLLTRRVTDRMVTLQRSGRERADRHDVRRLGAFLELGTPCGSPTPSGRGLRPRYPRQRRGALLYQSG